MGTTRSTPEVMYVHISWYCSPLSVIWLKQNNLYELLKEKGAWDVTALVLGIVLSSESAFGPSSPPSLFFGCLLTEDCILEDHCLSLVSIALLNTMTKSILGKKGHSPSLRRVKARTQGRNREAGTDARLWRDAAYWLVRHGLLNLLFNTTPCPRMALLTVDWAIPHQSFI